MGDLASLVSATLALYGRAGRDASRGLLRHPWIIGLVPAYTLAIQFVSSLAAPLGFAGGFVVFLAIVASASSFLAVIADVVGSGRVRFQEIGASFGGYFGRLVSVFFLFWILGLVLSMAVAPNPGLLWLQIAINVGCFVVFNAVPELIYQGRNDGMALLQDAIEFTRDNLVEWFVPVALMLLPFFLIDTQTGFLVMARLDVRNALDLMMGAVAGWLPLSGMAQVLVAVLLASTLLAWIMLFRGFLFRSLSGSNRRQRLFALRARG